jgi:hypothetical protein
MELLWTEIVNAVLKESRRVQIRRQFTLRASPNHNAFCSCSLVIALDVSPKMVIDGCRALAFELRTGRECAGTRLNAEITQSPE